MSPNLQRLVDAGIIKDPNALTQALKDSIESLSSQEIDAFISIKSKLDPKDLSDNSDNFIPPV